MHYWFPLNCSKRRHRSGGNALSGGNGDKRFISQRNPSPDADNDDATAVIITFLVRFLLHEIDISFNYENCIRSLGHRLLQECLGNFCEFRRPHNHPVAWRSEFEALRSKHLWERWRKGMQSELLIIDVIIMIYGTTRAQHNIFQFPNFHFNTFFRSWKTTRPFICCMTDRFEFW